MTGIVLYRNGIDVNLCGHTEAEGDDVGFVDVGLDEDLGKVGDHGDHGRGIVHRTGDHDFAFVGIELHGFAVDRRNDRGMRQARFRLLQNRLRLMDALDR